MKRKLESTTTTNYPPLKRQKTSNCLPTTGDIKKLKKENEALKKDNKKLKQENEKLNKTIKNLIDRNDWLKSKSSKTEDLVIDLNQKLNQIEKELQEENVEYMELFDGVHTILENLCTSNFDLRNIQSVLQEIEFPNDETSARLIASKYTTEFESRLDEIMIKLEMPHYDEWKPSAAKILDTLKDKSHPGNPNATYDVVNGIDDGYVAKKWRNVIVHNSHQKDWWKTIRQQIVKE